MEATPRPNVCGPIFRLLALTFVAYVVSLDVFYIFRNEDFICDELNPIYQWIISKCDVHSVPCCAATRVFTMLFAFACLNILEHFSERIAWLILILLVIQHVVLLAVLMK